jgi:hypothetical protein
MHSKEELIAYLKANPETEYPFVEEVWEQAVEKAKEDEEKQQPYRTIVTVDSDGNETVKKQKAGLIITDPIKQYFKLMGLVQNKRKGIALQEAQFEESESKQEILNTYFDDDETTTYMDEITSWIALFAPDERQFLKRRYASYYDTYEINDGADKSSLKGILSLEIELYRIDLKRAKGKQVNITDEKKLREMLESTFQSLKWTKKQRNAREDMAQNKFTVWMDNLVKDGAFKPNPKEYDEDEIDFIIKTSLEAQKEMLT